ncbi:MAG: hypothetical protein HC848_10800 [Limnobacter sp.]|nr:hypothetical protein [Limnobacter sp.]
MSVDGVVMPLAKESPVSNAPAEASAKGLAARNMGKAQFWALSRQRFERLFPALWLFAAGRRWQVHSYYGLWIGLQCQKRKRLLIGVASYVTAFLKIKKLSGNFSNLVHFFLK